MPESAVCKSDLPMGYIGPVRKEPTAALEIAPNLALHRGLFPDDPVKLAKPEEAAATTNPFLKFAKDLTNPMNANAGK